MIIFHQQVFHNCEMSKGCCVFKILSSVFAKTVQESFENATGFVRNVHFLQFVLPPDFYNCAKKFWNCHRVCRWDESALKALQGVKWPDAIYIIPFFVFFREKKQWAQMQYMWPQLTIIKKIIIPKNWSFLLKRINLTPLLSTQPQQPLRFSCPYYFISLPSFSLPHLPTSSVEEGHGESVNATHVTC